MTIAIYPGTFDPFTLGHVDLVERAARLFEKVIVAVATSTQKQTLFDLTERTKLGQAIFEPFSNVEVTHFKGLLMDFAKAQDAQVVVRGIRTIGDFDFELQLARMNRHLEPGVETMFILPSEKYGHISATLVREIAALGGDISSLVPENVKCALDKRLSLLHRSSSRGEEK